MEDTFREFHHDRVQAQEQHTAALARVNGELAQMTQERDQDV